VKPVGKAQGKGIFLINSLAQVRRWKDAHGLGGGANGIRDEKFVVSKYVDDPYLVGGRKFDLRVYVVVTGFKPLKAWVARAGFARFCVRKYVPVNSGNDGDLNDHFAHLTNVAIQKNHGAYSETHGGKWSLENLRVFLTGTRGLDATNALFTSLNAVILKSLRSVENVMHNDPHSFEVYGYDLLVDENLKPWLIEVNASPSLSATTDDDRVMKLTVIRDALAVAVPSDRGVSAEKAWKGTTDRLISGDVSWNGTASNSTSVGCLDLLVDDATHANGSARKKTFLTRSKTT